MYVKVQTLSNQLEEFRQKKHPYYLFNMVNEVLQERFLPIKGYNVKLRWVALFIWDNDKELLHGPFNLKGSIEGSYEFIEDYKWVDGELYVYFSGQTDYIVRGLENGKAVFSEV